MILHGVDTEGYHRYSNRHDLAVLAIGMQPSVDIHQIIDSISTDKSGFIQLDEANGAIFGAGCASNSLDVNRSVQNATAASLRAIQVIRRTGFARTVESVEIA